MRELSLNELKTVTGGVKSAEKTEKKATESAMPEVECLNRRRKACGA